MQQKLDPGAARVIDMAIKSGVIPPEKGTPDQARESFKASRAALAPVRQPVESVKDHLFDTGSGPIKVRIYRGLHTSEQEQLPCFIFFHSGGWVSGDLDTHDNPCRAIANLAHCCVIAVDYRLAPENPFPSAIDDAEAVYDVIVERAAALNIDKTKIAVGGDSAGANIATVLAILLRDKKALQPIKQILLYPATDFAADTPSRHENRNGPGLTVASLEWFSKHYLPNKEDYTNWKASPLRAPDLSDLPPTYLATCGFDPLRDEGVAYGDRLAEAGVSVTQRQFPGQLHGFLTMGGVVPETTILIGEVASALDHAFWSE